MSAPLTVEAVRERVQAIRDVSWDPEAAHELEDDLRADVLVAIAQGYSDARALAAEALTTSEIDFERWYA